MNTVNDPLAANNYQCVICGMIQSESELLNDYSVKSVEELEDVIECPNDGGKMILILERDITI